MRLLLSTLVILATFIPGVVMGETVSYGEVKIQEAQYDNLHHSGYLKLKQVQVAKRLHVTGRLKVDQSKVHQVRVNGQADFQESTLLGAVTIQGLGEFEKSVVKGPLQLTGMISAEESTFEQMITLRSQEMEFEDCTIAQINILPTETKEVQHLVLEGSQVLGDVHFELGNGVVHLQNGGKILGQLTGGTISHSN